MPSKNYPPHEFFPEPFLHMHITHGQQGSIMYQPRIEDEHIQQLYQWAKRLNMPMTRLVNALLAHALVRLEQGAESISERPESGLSAKKRKRRRAQYGTPTRTQPQRHRGG
jgi:hypothetical protein